MCFSKKKIRIVLTGGGTGGSVTPLIAIAQELQGRYGNDLEIMWIGMQKGIERTMTARYSFIYRGISAGKWRRYFSWKNVFDLLRVILGFIQSFCILIAFRPKLIITAGSFISVPVVWAGWLLRINILVHQQDLRPGLANKLMAACATRVTVAFEKSLDDYKHAQLVGNPVRHEFATPVKHHQDDKPVVLILGGGTGSAFINDLVADSLEDLLEVCKIIHITGKEKERTHIHSHHIDTTGYEFYDLLDTDHLAKAMQRADIVVTRAGLGTLSELSFLGKPTIIIPIPASHQEDNAEFFTHHGALVLNQDNIHPRDFSKLICDILNDKRRLEEMSQAIKTAMRHDANTAMLNIIDSLLK